MTLVTARGTLSLGDFTEYTDMSIQDDLLKLAELNKRVIQAVLDDDQTGLINALTDYQTLRKSLRTHFLDQTTASIDSVDAAEILHKICGGDGLATDKLIESLSSESEPDRPFAEFGDEELAAIGSDLFYSWFSHYEYITGLAELRPLVIRSPVGESVSGLLRQVKDCYAFQQYDAMYALCRTVLEASIRDICLLGKLLPHLSDNEILFEHITWKQLRNAVSSDPIQERRLVCLYSELCSVVHARKSVTKDEARLLFEETIQVVEQLYAAHRL